MRKGILGGTFNPPHLGHLIIAEHVREHYRLDRICFIPSNVPPHKQDLEIIDAGHRLEMVRRAIAGNEHFEASDIEVRRGGISYTVDTLRELKAKNPADVLFLLIGMDNLEDFPSWKNPGEIVELATVVAMTRPGFETAARDLLAGRRIQVCDVPGIGITSRVIRQLIREGQSVRYMVPDDVIGYIRKAKLYRK